MSMTNELRFSLEGISDVTLSYDEEQIAFYQAEGEELVIKEYMTEDKDRYHARVLQSANGIRISEGGKPFFKKGFLRRVEVFLPISYINNLTVTTTNGNIDLTNVKLRLSGLRIDSTEGKVDIDSTEASDIHLSTTRGILNLDVIKAGNLRIETTSGEVNIDKAEGSDIHFSATRGNFNIGEMEADVIQIETTSGNVNCARLSGDVEYISTSGDLDIKFASGAGSYKANNSGRLYVNYAEVTGDLYLFNKNDNIDLTLPENLSFEFEALTRNGTVSTTFQENITTDGRVSRGIVGDNPEISVKIETRNGDIKVTGAKD